MSGMDEDEKERQRRQRMRSIAIALALAALVVLFYAATIVRMGGNVMDGRCEAANQMTATGEQNDMKVAPRHSATVASPRVCGLLVLSMAGLAFAAVPLYRLYCQVTGYRRHARSAPRRRPTSSLDRDDHGALRRQRRRRACRGSSSPCSARSRSRSARTRWPSTGRPTSPTSRSPARRSSTSRPTRPASTSTRCSASASPSRRWSRARRWRCRCRFFVDPALVTDEETQAAHGDHAVLYVLSGRRRRRRRRPSAAERGGKGG